MSKRTWIYRRLMDNVPLVEERVFAKKGMTSSIEDTPYIVYKLGYNANEELAETVDAARQFIQVFIHDYSDGEVADYMRIDDVIAEVKAAFWLQSSAEDGIIAVKWLETSQDLNDETLNTVFKYVRFQLITKDAS